MKSCVYETISVLEKPNKPYTPVLSTYLFSAVLFQSPKLGSFDC